VAGGGVAALEAALALRRLAGDRVDVELVATEPAFRHRPLAVAEPFGSAPVESVDLERFAAEHGFRFRVGALVSVEPDRRLARTRDGESIPYDALVVACGAEPLPALPGALTFRGAADVGAFRKLLAEVDEGAIQRLAFALPSGATWPIPLYELALMTAARGRGSGRAADVSIVTHEDRPLELFGPQAGEAVAAMLERNGIAVLPRRYPTAVEDGVLHWVPAGELAVDRVVALPRLEGRRLAGLPHDSAGFLSTDPHGRVRGVPDVYAAGDVTAFPVKQGGLAAQQADAVAESVAAWAGVDLRPRPFRPVLRGKILTGDLPVYVQADAAGGRGDVSDASPRPLWWPPSKLAGRFLGPALAAAGMEPEPAPSLRYGVAPLPIQIDLEEGPRSRAGAASP
jgi:sulfide:quinone oxidoreductase